MGRSIDPNLGDSSSWNSAMTSTPINQFDHPPPPFSNPGGAGSTLCPNTASVCVTALALALALADAADTSTCSNSSTSKPTYHHFTI